MQPALSLDVQAIRDHLITRDLGRRIELHDHLDSTNREALALAQAGAEHGTVVLADAQTAGRGRLARTWYSPPGCNIYGSVLIRMPIDVARMPAWLSWLPLMAAVGAADAIEAVGPARVAVKWPNDLLIGDRKAGGILCESAMASGRGAFQLIGIGINVNGARQDFPEELREAATTIHEETGGVIDRNRLVAQLLNAIERYLDEFVACGSAGIASIYRRRCGTLGKTVKAVLADGNACIGVAQDISDDGSLALNEQSRGQTASGFMVRHLRAADIIHLR